MEKFFAEVGEPAKSRTIPPPLPPPTPAAMEAMAVAAKKQGTEVLPPS